MNILKIIRINMIHYLNNKKVNFITFKLKKIIKKQNINQCINKIINND